MTAGNADSGSRSEEFGSRIVRPWARAPLSDCGHLLKEGLFTIKIAERGTHMVMRTPPLLKALHELDDLERPNTEGLQESDVRSPNADELADADELARFAQVEIEKDFPRIRGLGLIYFWTCLETAIDDVLRACLKNEPSRFSLNGPARIEIGLLLADEEKRQAEVVERIKEDAKATLRGGVNCFEAPLKAIGFDGFVDHPIKTGLWTLYNVRNLLVHRGGRVDDRFAEACPYLHVPPGEQLIIAPGLFADCASSAIYYLATLMARISRDTTFRVEDHSDGPSPSRQEPADVADHIDDSEGA